MRYKRPIETIFNEARGQNNNCAKVSRNVLAQAPVVPVNEDWGAITRLASDATAWVSTLPTT